MFPITGSWLDVVILLLFCVVAEFTNRMFMNVLFRRVALRRLATWLRENNLSLHSYKYDRDDRRRPKRAFAFDIIAADTHGLLRNLRVYVGAGRWGLFGRGIVVVEKAS
jgi:hypothetical protein